MMPKDKVIITDTSYFILLQKIDAIELLKNLFVTVIATPEIANECSFPLPNWVDIRAVINNNLHEELKILLDAGEASAIALAYETEYDYLILDDLQARKFAQRKHLKVKGTIGVLLLAKQKGVIPFVKPYIEALQKTNFRISENLISQIFKLTEE